MPWVLLISVLLQPGWSDKCRAREWRCELRCGDKTPGGSMDRLRCYDLCREKERICKEEKNK